MMPIADVSFSRVQFVFTARRWKSIEATMNIQNDHPLNFCQSTCGPGLFHTITSTSISTGLRCSYMSPSWVNKSSQNGECIWNVPKMSNLRCLLHMKMRWVGDLVNGKQVLQIADLLEIKASDGHMKPVMKEKCLLILNDVMGWVGTISLLTFAWPWTMWNDEHCLIVPGIETPWCLICQSILKLVVSAESISIHQMLEETALTMTWIATRSMYSLQGKPSLWILLPSSAVNGPKLLAQCFCSSLIVMTTVKLYSFICTSGVISNAGRGFNASGGAHIRKEVYFVIFEEKERTRLENGVLLESKKCKWRSLKWKADDSKGWRKSTDFWGEHCVFLYFMLGLLRFADTNSTSNH